MSNVITFEDRLNIINDAIALKKTDRIPLMPLAENLVFEVCKNGATYRDYMYNFPKASEAILQFYKDYQLDAFTFMPFISGKANELAGSTMFDWPGRPGTKVSDHSTFQINEIVYMEPEEYPELLEDPTKFMITKYIPRAYPKLAGMANLELTPMPYYGTSALLAFYNPAVQEAFDIIKEMAKRDREASEASLSLSGAVASLGIPPGFIGFGLAPYDILGNSYRTTMGIMEDLIERPDMIEKTVNVLADSLLKTYDYMDYLPVPVKRVFWPLHKGMDGFMSPKQFETLYWKPLMKVVNGLADRGIQSLLYTEGKYDTRLHSMTDIPKGKCILHFENADITEAKKVFKDTVCLSGFIPAYNIQWGTVQQAVDVTKRYLDMIYDGGCSYIFDTNMALENGKRENWEAVLNTVRNYTL
jgi:uroporphyrinogen-III decarboxylase